MTEATVCQRCTFMRSYGDGLRQLQMGFSGQKEIAPCSNCGVGEVKIVDVNVNGWCESCYLHNSQCKCHEEEAQANKW